MAEDARIITLRKQAQERLFAERTAAAQRESEAKARAAAEAQRREQAETDRTAAEQAKQQAEEAALRAQRERAAADAARAAADSARTAALEQQQQAQQQAEEARRAAEQANQLRLQAETEKANLRKQLLDQLNKALETRDTARGLIVNMSDVLFDLNKYTLRPEAREKLAKISGIVMSHPGLKLQVEGHTDSTGTDEYNQKLSEERAESVRNYLVEQGIPADSVTAQGFGESRPIASNDTAAGRQRNRRVEMVVSGDIIGTPSQTTTSAR